MFGLFTSKWKTQIPSAEEALPGRSEGIFPVPETHFVSGHRIQPAFPDGLEEAVFGLGCFWGAERLFWNTRGVWTTAVGYQGGETPNPTYKEVCSGRTGHTESVLVVFDPAQVRFAELLQVFWDNHDPTQGMRQGNDVGTQYRSAIYTTNAEQHRAASDSLQAFAERLATLGWVLPGLGGRVDGHVEKRARIQSMMTPVSLSTSGAAVCPKGGSK